MGGLSIWHWLIVLLVVVLIFGTKKLKNMGSDLGGAVKGFISRQRLRAIGCMTVRVKSNVRALTSR